MKALFVKLLIGLSLIPSICYSQCLNDNISENLTLTVPCDLSDTVLIGAGTYADVVVLSGATYTFSTCGSGFDTQLTGYEGNQTSSVFFNDDNGPECSGMQASVSWTASFDGTLRLLVDYMCDSCGSAPSVYCPGLGSAVLQYKQDNDLVITSSSADICSGESRTLTATPVGGTFSGVGVSGNIFTPPNSTTSYDITYSLGACSVKQTLNVFQNPTVSVSGKSDFCPGDSVILTATALAGSGTITNYQWKRGSFNVGGNVATFTVKLAGNYTVDVTNSNGCTTTSPVKQVIVFSPPTVIILGDDAFCPGGSVMLTANSFPGSGAITTHQWKRDGINVGFNSSTYQANQVGNYTVVVTNSNGCKTESAVKAIGEYVGPGVTITDDTSFCSGSSVVLTANTVTGSRGIDSYQWKLNGGDVGLDASTHFADQVGNYSVLVIDSNGCTALSGSSLITQKPALAVFASGSDVLCAGDSNGTATVVVTGGRQPYSFLWSNDSTDLTITGLKVGTYTVTVSDDNGCSIVSNDVTINDLAALMLVLTDKTDASCDSEKKGSLTVKASGGNRPYFYYIDDGPFQPTGFFKDLPDGSYVATVQDANGCVISTSPIVIKSISSLPDATIESSSNTICDGDSIVLKVNANGADVLWSTGETTDSIFVKEGGTYSATLTELGCVDSNSVILTVFDPINYTVSPDTNISKGFSVQLYATGGVFYAWEPEESLDNPGSDIPIASPLENTTYTVTIKDENECIVKADVNVEVLEDFRFVIPNLITPNGDGRNETWRIKGIDQYVCEVVIFNRWGSEVFSSKNYLNEWDGTKGGDQLPDGTYYYTIVCSGSDVSYKGAITILR